MQCSSPPAHRLASPLLDPINDFQQGRAGEGQAFQHTSLLRNVVSNCCVRNDHLDQAWRSIAEHARAIRSALRPRLEASPV